MTKGLQRWWGDYPIEAGMARRWDIGGFVLIAAMQDQEVRLHSRADSAEQERFGVSEPGEVDGLIDDLTELSLVRHITHLSDCRLVVRPALADRAVVSKPLHRLLLHPRERATVYVSTPLWLQLRPATGEHLMLDCPLIRPSDTWFGVNTREGELCYASRTNARLSLDEVPVSAMRAVTAVELSNASDAPLAVDKVCLPVSYLSLFVDDSDRLWTEPVSISCEQQNEPSALTIQHERSLAEPRLERVSGPREEARSGLIHSLNVLFG